MLIIQREHNTLKRTLNLSLRSDDSFGWSILSRYGFDAVRSTGLKPQVYKSFSGPVLYENDKMPVGNSCLSHDCVNFEFSNAYQRLSAQVKLFSKNACIPEPRNLSKSQDLQNISDTAQFYFLSPGPCHPLGRIISRQYL